MLRSLQQLLRLSGQINTRKDIVSDNDQKQSSVVLVSQELIGLFAQIRERSRCGLHQERRRILMELLQSFGEALEITEAAGEFRVVHIRPRQARFSALLVLQADEIDEEMDCILYQHLIQQPGISTPSDELAAESPGLQAAWHQVL